MPNRGAKSPPAGADGQRICGGPPPCTPGIIAVGGAPGRRYRARPRDAGPRNGVAHVIETYRRHPDFEAPAPTSRSARHPAHHPRSSWRCCCAPTRRTCSVISGASCSTSCTRWSASSARRLLSLGLARLAVAPGLAMRACRRPGHSPRTSATSWCRSGRRPPPGLCRSRRRRRRHRTQRHHAGARREDLHRAGHSARHAFPQIYELIKLGTR